MLELQLSSKSQTEHVDVINTDTTAGPPINATDWTMHFDMPQADWNETLESASETVDQAGWQDNGIQSQLQQTLIQPEEIAIVSLQHGKATNEILDSTGLSHLMKLDLDQLYFDRVHPLIPMVHRSHYLAWAKLDDVSLPQKCLRWAMRALAASMSSQFRSRSDEFYNKARRLAEGLDAGDLVLPWLNSDTSIEQAQTWLLLAHYELLDPSKYSQSATTRRAFRLVHLSRLHCTDWKDPALDFHSCTPGTSQSAPLPFASVEERRRTFWVAFCLDRFLGGYEESPMTIHDETIHVHLPCPEWNFQISSEVNMGFINDVLIGGTPVPASSPFAKLVIAMALFGQCILHKKITAKCPTSDQESLTFWVRHELLAEAIDRQVALLSLRQTDVEYEPLHFMTSMVVHGSVLKLENAINVAHSVVQSQQPVANDYAKTAYKAAISMADLSESMTGSNCLKTHVYLPMLLGKAFLYLAAHAEPSQSQHSKAKLLALLESLKEIHGQAKQFIDGLELWDTVGKMESGTMNFITGQME
ncbi:hypothetical protein FOVG_16270 [Fusarium oxysporum f. sp. pisi HDV247]|uniref:Xylanolytic transcriptional activator regulatory domain-containing protein n=1 Tax=Fusarium oxysporum f. sp. pisi HDV247 TaxID=1080344 RepID=W9NIP4_FUSOX|nr:hypothetical protein FOVG_16270 [Fusarium oxysporum f. sp. pisi HDV247]